MRNGIATPSVVAFTSFRRRVGYLPGSWDTTYSIARWQPKFVKPPLLRLDLFVPERADGSPILLRDFEPNPIEGYAAAFRKLWEEREEDILHWLAANYNKRILCCCWCPYSRSAGTALREYGSFACHSLLIARELKSLGTRVILDDDRVRYGIRDWSDW